MPKKPIGTLCRNPFMKGPLPFGCGQCMPCRISRRRLWTHRLLLEQLKHNASCFLTLTYSEEELPHGSNLYPKHTQDWLKRLRRASPDPIRYYLVGEYGEETQRPHYHAAIFGLGPEYAELIERTWSLGHIHVGDLTKDSAAYITGYVTKKMTSPNDPRLKGRHPEFARMSLRPGIGATAMEDVAKILTTDFGCDEIAILGDVPQVLKHGTRDLPLGRYLKFRLRKILGFPDPEKSPPEVLNAFKVQMLELYQSLSQGEAFPKNPEFKRDAQKKILVDSTKQKVLNLETKQKIYSSKGKL